MNQCLSNEEIDEKFGKLGFFQKNGSQALISKVDYFGGIQLFDDNKLAGGPIVFDKRPKGLVIQSLMKSKIKIGIFDDNIKYYTIEHKDNIIGKKEKSVIGRAIVGGVLLGPLGAIVGGISGIGENDVKSKAIPDNILTIVNCEEGVDMFICFSLSMKNFKAAEDYFFRHYKEKAKYEM